MEFIKGTAICTGGGMYEFIGETSTNQYFHANNYAVGIYDINPCEEDGNGGFLVWNEVWQAEHEVTNLDEYDELWDEVLRFINRLINGTQDQTGYEHLKNFCTTDLERVLEAECRNKEA